VLGAVWCDRWYWLCAGGVEAVWHGPRGVHIL
jgi:hypothetical protein